MAPKINTGPNETEELTAVAGSSVARERPLPTHGRVMWMPVARRRRFALSLNPGQVRLR